jgi:hypothetical protein
VFTALTDAQAWLAVVILLAAVVLVVTLFATTRAVRSGRAPAAPAAKDEESILRELSAIDARLTALEEGIGRVAEALPRVVQGVGVVRYNPFPEMGSNMSFSVAFLDGRANGVVVSVLTNREGSRVYGKAVEGGTSSYPLSEEERQALALAQENRA